MYPILLQLHSITRYVVIVLLIYVVLKSLFAILRRNTFSKFDQISSISLSSVSHIQLLSGLILYFSSPWVIFSNETMSNASIRYWTVEHIMMMVIAVILITLGGIFSKRETVHVKKYRKLLIYNSIAVFVIVATILMSGRGLI